LCAVCVEAQMAQDPMYDDRTCEIKFLAKIVELLIVQAEFQALHLYLFRLYLDSLFDYYELQEVEMVTIHVLEFMILHSTFIEAHRSLNCQHQIDFGKFFMTILGARGKLVLKNPKISIGFKEKMQIKNAFTMHQSFELETMIPRL
jgi:hypothetical protein